MELAKIYGICFLIAGSAFIIYAISNKGKSKKSYWIGGVFIAVGGALIFNLIHLH